MLQLQKITDVEMDNIKEIVQKGVEKSELERFYLFSTKLTEKAKLFCYCHRFLYHLYNILTDSNLKNLVKEEVEITFQKYVLVNKLLFENDRTNFGSHRNKMQLHSALYSDKIADDLIDAFAILLERANLLDINKIQAFVLEGKSKEEYNKIFKSKEDVVEEVQEQQLEESDEELEEDYEEPKDAAEPLKDSSIQVQNPI